MTTNEKISALRSAVTAAGLDAYFITCTDPHCGEYLPAHWRTLGYFSGFTGENSTLIITADASAIWVDGRFFVQADNQVGETEIQVMKMGEPDVPTREDWLASQLKAGMVCGFDGFSTPAAVAKGFADKGIKLKSVDLASALWEGRPALPGTPVFTLPAATVGQTQTQRLAAVREKLAAANADAMVVGALDEVAWLLNVRAADVTCTPYCISFAIVLPDRCVFCTDNPVSEEVKAELAAANVTVSNYDEVVAWAETCPESLRVLADQTSLNYKIVTALRDNTDLQVVEGTSPISMLKAVKTPEELAATRNAHIKDGVAMVQFWMDMERWMASGKPFNELDVDDLLHARRSAQEGFLTESFNTIAAYGPNGAMMHYGATPESYSQILPKGYLLVDCGGTYTDGTTDITRTYQMGELTEQEKELYTWVLQSHICMAKAVWLDYCTGFALDTYARAPMWAHLLNYRCGTGHGVAFVGSVHEGPQSLRPNNNVVFKPGMVITDEPGVYETDWLGIRIENELVCVAKETNQYGNFLAFEPITFVPIDLKPVKKELLNKDEIDWLNRYHAMTYEVLAPYLNEEEKAFLAEKTKAI